MSIHDTWTLSPAAGKLVNYCSFQAKLWMINADMDKFENGNLGNKKFRSRLAQISSHFDEFL